MYSQEIIEDFQARTMLGFHFAQVFPLNLVKNNDILSQVDSLTLLESKNVRGYLFGMEVRHDFNQITSLKTGINFIRRNYDITVTNLDSSFTSRLQYIGYEIPVMALVYLRLTKNIFMDYSAGMSMNFYPSDVTIPHFWGMRKRWFNTGLIANVGWDYRTEENGVIYFGFLYQYQFNHMMQLLYFKGERVGIEDSRDNVGGSYLAVSLKYFFPNRKK